MHSIAWHHIPPIPHSQELFCFACWLHPNHAPLTLPNHTRLYFFVFVWSRHTASAPSTAGTSSHVFCLSFVLNLLLGFCSRFLFFWLSFLLAGSLCNSGFVHLSLLFLILRISGFSPFSRISRSGRFSGFSPFSSNSRSGWFLICLGSRFGGQIRSGASGLPYYCAPFVCISIVIGLLAVWRHNKPKTKNQKPKNHSHPRTLQPVTSPSFYPAPSHTSHPTTPYHLTTAPYHLHSRPQTRPSGGHGCRSTRTDW